MTDYYDEKIVNIYQYPTWFESKTGLLTIGDLHGNVIKLLHLLFRYNIIQFNTDVIDPAAAYDEWVRMYEKNEALITVILANGVTEQTKKELASHLNLFNDYLNNIEVITTTLSLRFMGDETADRGANDYFTLRLLALLREKGVKLSILLSNHGHGFIKYYEAPTPEEASFIDIHPGYKNSLYGLMMLVDEGLIADEELIQLITGTYQPLLQLIDYSLTEDGIIIFTHAPVGFHIIQELAQYFGLVYDDSNKEKLASTIMQLNKKFKEIVINNQVDSLFKERNNDLLTQNPFIYLTWNRWSYEKDLANLRPDMVNHYHITYIHGHDSYPSPFKHVINLDTLSGKCARKRLPDIRSNPDFYKEKVWISTQAKSIEI